MADGYGWVHETHTCNFAHRVASRTHTHARARTIKSPAFFPLRRFRAVAPNVNSALRVSRLTGPRLPRNFVHRDEVSVSRPRVIEARMNRPGWFMRSDADSAEISIANVKFVYPPSGSAATRDSTVRLIWADHTPFSLLHGNNTTLTIHSRNIYGKLDYRPASEPNDSIH